MTITLKDVGSGFKRTAINENFDTIESELNNNVLRRDSVTGSNQMEVDIDMNSQRLLNLVDAINGREPVTLDQLNGALSAASSGLIAAQQEQQTGAQVVGGVTTFTGITYTVSSNNLYVFRNGNYQTKGVDYNETSTSSITWTTVPNATDALVFITNLATTNSVADTAAISHSRSGLGHNLATYLNRRRASVEDYGVLADGVSDSTASLKAAILADKPLEFPEGIILVDEIEISTLVGGKLNWQGQGRGKTVIKPFSTGNETLFKIRNSNLFEASGITFDGDSKAGVGVYILDAAAEVAGGKNIYVHGCEFKSFTGDATNGNAASGLQVVAGVTDLRVVDCSFKDISGANTATGIGCGGATAYGIKQTQITACVFDNIGPSTDSDAIRVVSSETDSLHEIVQVTGCRFKNAFYRSVKTQARHTIVANNFFENTTSTSRTAAEVDIQRGSSVVVGNSFRYAANTNCPISCISVRAYDTDANVNNVAHNLSNNTFRCDSGNLTIPFDIKAELGGELRKCFITNNIVVAVCNTFASVNTTSTNTATRLYLDLEGNTVAGLVTGFLFLVRGSSDPVDSGSNGKFVLNLSNNINQQFSGPAQLIEVNNNTTGDNLSVVSQRFEGNVNLNPALVDARGNTHLDTRFAEFDGGNVALHKYVDDTSTVGVRWQKAADVTVQASTSGNTGSRTHHSFYNPNGLIGSIGTKGSSLEIVPTGSVFWTAGSGTPEGVVTSAVGGMYTRTDGGSSTTLYVKEAGTGNTGWVAK